MLRLERRIAEGTIEYEPGRLRPIEREIAEGTIGYEPGRLRPMPRERAPNGCPAGG